MLLVAVAIAWEDDAVAGAVPDEAGVQAARQAAAARLALLARCQVEQAQLEFARFVRVEGDTIALKADGGKVDAWQPGQFFERDAAGIGDSHDLLLSAGIAHIKP